MIVKMSQKDSEEDIEKAYNLFVEQEKNAITFASLKRVVEDLSKFHISIILFLNLSQIFR